MKKLMLRNDEVTFLLKVIDFARVEAQDCLQSAKWWGHTAWENEMKNKIIALSKLTGKLEG